MAKDPSTRLEQRAVAPLSLLQKHGFRFKNKRKRKTERKGSRSKFGTVLPIKRAKQPTFIKMPGSADNPNVYAGHPSNGNTLHWQTVIQPFFKGLIVIINLPTRQETGERQTVYPAGLVNHFKTSWPFLAPIVGSINGSILYNADKSSRVCTFSSPKSRPVLLRKMLILLSFLISSVAAADLGKSGRFHGPGINL